MLKVQVEEIGEQRLVLLEVNLVLNKDCFGVNLEGGRLLGGSVLEMMVDVVVIVLVEILTRRLKLKPRINPPPCSHQEHREQRDSDMIEDIGVAYALVGVSSSVLVVVDMAGVGGSNDNGRNCGSGIGEFGVGDFGGKSMSCQVSGIKATGKIQVAVNVTPYPSFKKILDQYTQNEKSKRTNSPMS